MLTVPCSVAGAGRAVVAVRHVPGAGLPAGPAQGQSAKVTGGVRLCEEKEEEEEEDVHQGSFRSEKKVRGNRKTFSSH